MQPLPGGGVFVGWGGTNRDFTEYDSHGHVVFDAFFTASGAESYRAYRFAWTGTPAAPPRAALTRTAKATHLYASWNGATDVAAWRVLAGPSRSALAPAATVARTGFETAITIPGHPASVVVQALGASGAVLRAAGAAGG
jgi:hypothetical protein